MIDEATPRPWKVRHDPTIPNTEAQFLFIESDSRMIANINRWTDGSHNLREEDAANAQLIVTAVNERDGLIDLLRDAREIIATNDAPDLLQRIDSALNFNKEIQK